jgi:hypothetical protein
MARNNSNGIPGKSIPDCLKKAQRIQITGNQNRFRSVFLEISEPDIKLCN